MAKASLTPKEYELHLRDLRDRLSGYLERGEGDVKTLLHDAESVFELADAYPDLIERNEDVQGLLAEVLARRQQQKFIAQPEAQQERPGCLLGWLFPRGRSR